MTSNHIDQLREWWESAEKGAPSKGDAIIRRTERLLSNGYAYEVGTEDYTDAKHLDNVRILSRAPKPAWHDALAVLASCKYDAPDRGWGTFINDRSGQWLDESGKRYVSDDLTDVTPLIKAEVTDEMVDRYWAAMKNPGSNYDEAVRRALASALGLEAE